MRNRPGKRIITNNIILKDLGNTGQPQGSKRSVGKHVMVTRFVMDSNEGAMAHHEITEDDQINLKNLDA